MRFVPAGQFTMRRSLLVVVVLMSAIAIAADQADADRVQAQAKELFNQSKYADARAVLSSHLERDPDNLRIRSMLLLTVIRLDDAAAVDSEANQLAAVATRRGLKANEQVNAILLKYRSRRALRTNIKEAFTSLDLQRVRELIRTADLTPIERAVAQMTIQKATGDFEGALSSASLLTVSSEPENSELSPQMRYRQNSEIRDIRADAETYTHASCLLEAILQSFNGVITFDRSPRLQACLTVDQASQLLGVGLEQRTAVQKLTDIMTSKAPLSPKTAMMVNNLLLNLGSYGDFEAFADRMMKLHGVVELTPELMTFVRGKERNLVFAFRLSPKGIDLGEGLTIVFDNVRGFEQRKRGRGAVTLYSDKNGKLECDHCFLGATAALGEAFNMTPDSKIMEGVQIACGVRMGQYIKHVAQLPDKAVSLMEIPKAGSGVGGILGAFALGATAALANNAEGMQAATQNATRSVTQAAERRQAFDMYARFKAQTASFDLRRLTDLLAGGLTTEIETLLRQ